MRLQNAFRGTGITAGDQGIVPTTLAFDFLPINYDSSIAGRITLDFAVKFGREVVYNLVRSKQRLSSVFELQGGSIYTYTLSTDHAMQTQTRESLGIHVGDNLWKQGGIDLSTSSGMKWTVSKDGQGVEMDIDPAMIQRIQREGIDWLSPVIFRITPIISVWPLMGLQAPVKEERLAGV